MKHVFFLISILVCVIHVNAQLKANAGTDIMVCYPNSVDARTTLGGNPVASGGVEPYEYTWSGRQVKYNSPEDSTWVYASKFLNDTTISNPSFKSIDAPEKWAAFYLKVEDAAGNSAYDTVRVIDAFITSGGNYMLPVTIHRGDSIQFFGYHYTFYSNFPLECSLTPTIGLNDPSDFYGWAKPDTSTTYYLQVVNSAGCISKSYYWRVNVEQPNATESLESNQLAQCYLSKGDLIIHLPQKQSVPYEVTIATSNGVVIHRARYMKRDLKLSGLKLKEKQLYVVSIVDGKEKQVFKVMGN